MPNYVSRKVHEGQRLSHLRSVETDACPETVPGFLHVYAACGGMGLEYMHISWTSYAPSSADGTPAVDGAEAAEELCGMRGHAVQPLFQGAALWELQEHQVLRMKTLLKNGDFYCCSG